MVVKYTFDFINNVLDIAKHVRVMRISIPVRSRRGGNNNTEGNSTQVRSQSGGRNFTEGNSTQVHSQSGGRNVTEGNLLQKLTTTDNTFVAKIISKASSSTKQKGRNMYN